MTIEQIATLEDERVAPYRELRLRGVQSGLFIVEGPLLIERLLQSRFEVVSLLASPNHVDRVHQLTGSRPPVLELEYDLMRRLVGFPFHRGMLACAKRRLDPPLEGLLCPSAQQQTIVACPLLRDGANVGSILRIAASFGSTGCLLGPHCADPFSRQALRVSMGTALTIPIRRSDTPLQDLKWLMREGGFQSIATVLDADAESIKGATAPQRLVLVVGSEDEGLDDEWVSNCDRRVTIPMQLGTDSLNVAVATAIVLHQLRG